MIPGWKEEIVGEYLEFLRESGKATPADVAARLGVSECCAIYWLTDLARNGRVRIVAFESVEEDGASPDRRSPLICQRQASCPIPDGGKVLDEAA